MKKSKVAVIVLIVVILVAAIVGAFYYFSNKPQETKEEPVVVTVVQSVLMRDLERNYPPTPKEVLKYYSQITECFYNEEYSDEELEALALKIQELYDDELVANKSQEDYMTDLRDEIADMKKNKYTIAGFEVSASTDVEEFVEDGYECARLYCTFNIKQTGVSGVTASMEQFVLRKDEDGHWKILGWELVND